MALWRIYPIAAPGDSRWQGRQIWREVIIRAPSAAFARVVATRLAGQAQRRYATGNESQAMRSGFLDEKLYWVRRLSPEDAAAYEHEGPPEVLGARLEEEALLLAAADAKERT